MNTIDEILNFAIANEEGAATFYTQLAEQADRPWLKELLLSFAREERGHKAKLLAIKGGKRFDPLQESVMDLKIADYLVDVEPHLGMSYQEVLIVAMQQEKAAFRLYNDLADRATDPSLAATFRSLAQEEAKHKLRFELEYDDCVLAEN